VNNKTSAGLRDRLFDSLDLFIEKKITSKEIEGICYLSEQIIKTANIELEVLREENKANQLRAEHKLLMEKERAASAKLLGETIDNAGRYNE